MQKTLLLLAALAILAACRETNTGQQSRPTAESMAPARTLRFDTTFLALPPGARTYRHAYTSALPLGRAGKASLPITIEWTTTQAGGCAQVAAVRVYQLGRADDAATLSARARRDARCRPGSPPAGNPARAQTQAQLQAQIQAQALNPAYTGLVLLQLTGVSRSARTFANVSLTLSGLGYHDILVGSSPTSSAATLR